MEGRPRVPPHVDSMQGMSDQGGGKHWGLATRAGASIGGWRPGRGQALGVGDQGGGKPDLRFLVEPMLAYMWYYRARYSIVLL